MGRKPNPLVNEFFNRGNKLEDSSNRYEYTCKACDKFFERGRIDTLTRHLQTCGAIHIRDRRRALLKANGGLDSDISESGEEANQARISQVAMRENEDLTGLQLLAQASDYAEHPENISDPPRTERDLVDPSLKCIMDFVSASNVENGYTGQVSSVGITEDLVAAQQNYSYYVSSSDTVPLTAKALDLSQIAASASDLNPMIPYGPYAPTRSTNGYEDNRNSTIASPSSFRSSSTWYTQASQPTNDENSIQPAPPTSQYRQIEMNVTQESSDTLINFDAFKNTMPRLQKVRGPLSDSRRLEVKSIRKKGACIRCRMLRKTCSGENPCSQCTQVKEARLWKIPCVRTHLFKELEVYSASLFACQALAEVDPIVRQMDLVEYPACLEVSLLIASHKPVPVIMSLAVLKGSPRMHEQANLSRDAMEDVYLINDNSDDVPSTLKDYAGSVGPALYSQELSNAMRHTLIQASHLCVEKNDLLLAKVLNLWTLTHILVDAEVGWRFRLHLSFESTPEHSFQSPPSDYIDISEIEHKRTYALLCAQLRHALEKQASDLCKLILVDLDYRLMHRAQCQGFETFLVGWILLSCVEKMCWLFQLWHSDQGTSKWPLIASPDYYMSQCDRFTDLVTDLLKMRAVTGSIYNKDDNAILKIVDTDGGKTAKEWLQLTGLTYTHLRRFKHFDPGNSRSLELRFCSKMLLLHAWRQS